MKRLLLALALPALMSGCYARAVYAVQTDPPPPQYEEVVVRPGYVWIGGHWNWQNRWIWAPGYYEVDRPGYVWAGGGCTHPGASPPYPPGYWRPRPTRGVVVVPSRPARPGPWRPGPSKPGPSRPPQVHDYRK